MRRLIVILLIAASMFTAIVPTSAQGRKQRVRGATGAKWTKDENGEDVLSTIDDDEEFDLVADAFDDAVFSEVDYDAE